MILQRSQRRFTDADTFISNPSFSESSALPEQSLCSKPVRNPAPGQIVRGELYANLVSGRNTNVMHTKLPRDVREHLVAVIQLNAEHRVWKRFGYFSLNFNDVLLGQISSRYGTAR